jgi:hypothetical protein
MFQVPMESLEPVGLSTFFADLEAGLQGVLVHQLASSVSYASSIMWPEKLAREPLFVWVLTPRDSVVGRFIDRFAPRYHCALTESAVKFLGHSLEWAV